MIKRIVTASLLASLSWVAPAAPQQQIDCGYPLNRDERQFCAEQTLAEAEADMNASFESAFAKLRALDPTLPEQLQGSFAALEEAQISWRAFRQKDCDAYAGPFRAGEDGEMAFLGCMILQTRQRSDQLSAMIDDYGG